MEPLPAKTANEAKLVTFDFSKEAAIGAAIASPVLGKSTLVGNDPGAALLTLGDANIVGQLVHVLVSGGAADAVYSISCRVTASNDEIHELFGRLPIASSV